MKPKVFSFLKLKDLVEVLREKKIQSHYWNGTSREMKVNYTGKHTKEGWAEARQGRVLYGPRT